jgi:hypothetical protein
MSFRRTFTVLTEGLGGYVNGIYTPGARSTLTIEASIQPVTGEDMITAPEGRRIQDLVKVYTTATLKQADEGTGQQPDIIVWQGYGYEVTSMDVRAMGVIDHNKVFATRRMPVPNPAAWTAGTLQRG